MSSISNIEGAKSLFLRNLDRLQGSELTEFITWVKEVIDETQNGADGDTCCTNDSTHCCTNESTRDDEDNLGTLNTIIEELRGILPIDAMAPAEKTSIPRDEEHADYTEKNTVHVDSFLYDDDEVDRLCDDGQMSRAICNACGSQDTTMLNFISHSASLSQLQFLYNHALGDLTGKSVLDVGSRTGAVLYAGYLFSSAKELIGVEMNSYFADISSKIVTQHNMQDRISITEGDIMKHPKILAGADVVVLNNVFQFFHSPAAHAKFWTFLRSTIVRKGTMLVTVPEISGSLRSAQLDMDTASWVEEITLDYAEYDADEESDIRAVHLYRVI